MKAKDHEARGRGAGLTRLSKTVRSLLALIAWIVIWAVIAWAIGSPVILASPAETATALFRGVLTGAFWMSIGTTFLHVVAGLVCACLLGVLLGIAASRWTWVDFLLAPAMAFIKSAPIVCFIVLLLVWFGSDWVDLAAVLLAVMPIYFFSTQEAYRQRDKQLLEMLHVFNAPLSIRLRTFELPSILPYFRQATRVAVGMSWKSGATAELIGLTAASIGEQIYLAKLTLDTASLLMWTIVVVLLGFGFEKLVLWLVERAFNKVPSSKGVTTNAMAKGPNPPMVSEKSELPKPEPLGLLAEGLRKSFDGSSVVQGFSYEFQPGSRTCIMAPTGTGKTTLARMLLGLEEPDAGQVSRFGTSEKLSAVFQETRLLPGLTATQNVALVAGISSVQAENLLGMLLDVEAWASKPHELSGGMKRCVELCRALAAAGGAVILDEPFAGLDEQKRAKAIDLVLQELHGRTLILITHDAGDGEAMDCDKVELR